MRCQYHGIRRQTGNVKKHQEKGQKQRSNEWARRESNPHVSSVSADAARVYGDGFCDIPSVIRNDPDLAEIVAAWPTLPETVRADIVGRVRRAAGK